MANYYLKYDLASIKANLQAAMAKGTIGSVVIINGDICVSTEEDLDATDESALKAAIVTIEKEFHKAAEDPITGKDVGEIEKKI